MTVHIQYAYLKQQTWLYRRNYPAELQPLLGSAFKQSLKTGDARLAKARAAEVNAKFEEIVAKAKVGVRTEKPVAVRVVAPVFAPVVLVGRVTVGELAKQYLNRRSDELRPGAFKSVRFSIGLFASSLGSRPIGAVRRDEALGFTRQVALLGRHVGKTFKRRGYSLERLVAASEGQTISAATQQRTVGQVSQFMDWAIYEGHLEAMVAAHWQRAKKKDLY